MTSEEFIQPPVEKVSKFNSTLAKLERLDEAWRRMHTAVRNGRFLQWNVELDRVFCELTPVDKEHKKKFNEFKKKIAEAKHDAQNLYEVLFEKEVFIREVEDKQGLGKAYKDEFEDDF